MASIIKLVRERNRHNFHISYGYVKKKKTIGFIHKSSEFYKKRIQFQVLFGLLRFILQNNHMK